MPPAANRKHLLLLAAEDHERLGRGKGLATWAADIGFWAVCLGVVGVIVYAIYFAPRG